MCPFISFCLLAKRKYEYKTKTAQKLQIRKQRKSIRELKERDPRQTKDCGCTERDNITFIIIFLFSEILFALTQLEIYYSCKFDLFGSWKAVVKTFRSHNVYLTTGLDKHQADVNFSLSSGLLFVNKLHNFMINFFHGNEYLSTVLWGSKKG